MKEQILVQLHDPTIIYRALVNEVHKYKSKPSPGYFYVVLKKNYFVIPITLLCYCTGLFIFGANGVEELHLKS